MIRNALFSIPLVVFGLFSAACGEGKNTCDKARDVQKRICRESNSEKCLPCPCILKGKDINFMTDAFGVPDPSNSHCLDPDPQPCEGIKLELAQECIENEQTCDPRYFSDIKMFDNGEPEPGFEDICDGDW